MNRMFKPAFDKQNCKVSTWTIILFLGYLTYFFFPYPSNRILPDPARGLAIADADLRTVAMNRMREVCFSEQEISRYWYQQEYMLKPNNLLVIIKAREALCGGRGKCKCRVKAFL